MSEELKATIGEYLTLDKQYQDSRSTITPAESGYFTRRLSRLQRKLDYLLSELKIEATSGTDWAMAARAGCSCKKKA